MEIREAFLTVASLIEANPKMWDYMNTRVPRCGARGCLVGLVAAVRQLGLRGQSVYKVAADVIGVDHYTMDDRMIAINNELGFVQDDCYDNAATAARCIRIYADRFHPAASH